MTQTNKIEIQKITTRLRAYQLGNEGSSFSYCDGLTFTLIEARMTEMNEKWIKKEMKLFGKSRVDVSHITSWDNDHCRHNELINIMNELKSKRIEMPGYSPVTDSSKQDSANRNI